MITLTFDRKAVCMADDASSAVYTIEMPDDATLGDLIYVIMHGGNGNKWPVPYSGASYKWIIESNIGVLAEIFNDDDMKTQINYLAASENTSLSTLGIAWTFGNPRYN